jgi:hypothetical protein
MSGLALQGLFLEPDPHRAPEAVSPPPAPFLVNTTDNSAEPTSPLLVCPDSRWIVGTCQLHQNVQWVEVPCKKRTCDVCGPRGRYEIAQRIARGVVMLGGPETSGRLKAAWLVLTFDHDIDKRDAVKRLAPFVRWLRTKNPVMEYAATYELTKRGRLHINLIAAPWVYVPHQDILRNWGARVSVNWIRDDRKIGQEAAKSYSPKSLGNYVSKLSQSVPSDRRVSYSRRWPRSEAASGAALGVITWSLPDHYVDRFQLGVRGFCEVSPRHFALTGRLCLCFGGLDNTSVVGLSSAYGLAAPSACARQ